jgi:isoamylase
MTCSVEPGSAQPLGATIHPDGVNFSLFSESATEVALLLFDRRTAIEPAQVIRLDPFHNKTFHFWHVFREGR